MDLIIGGAYQGKLSYARERFELAEAEICFCTEEAEPDWEKRCFCHLESYVLGCLRRGEQPAPRLRPDAVVICRDISSGVVPMDATLRAWREETGRLLCRLAREAESVTRVFCGLPQHLK